jgi:hypothetical protein
VIGHSNRGQFIDVLLHLVKEEIFVGLEEDHPNLKHNFRSHQMKHPQGILTRLLRFVSQDSINKTFPVGTTFSDTF